MQVLGEGNNRHITLIHRIQVRRFCNDLLKTIKWQVNRTVLFSQLPHMLAFTLNRTFSITDYGVCTLTDMLDELEAAGLITIERIVSAAGNDILISLPKHKQTAHEIERTLRFAAEVCIHTYKCSYAYMQDEGGGGSHSHLRLEFWDFNYNLMVGLWKHREQRKNSISR